MTNLTQIIDDLGALKAQIADLKIKEDALKASLYELAVGDYEGDLFRLSVTAPVSKKPSAELKALDKKAVAAFRATLSHQYLTAHNPDVATPTLTVRARTGVRIAA